LHFGIDCMIMFRCTITEVIGQRRELVTKHEEKKHFSFVEIAYMFTHGDVYKYFQVMSRLFYTPIFTPPDKLLSFKRFQHYGNIFTCNKIYIHKLSPLKWMLIKK
jgi:hypothetical protein